MIITLSGRKQSGKTLLAKIAEKHGFKILSFASALKDVIRQLLDMKYGDLSMFKEQEINFCFSEAKVQQLSSLSGLSLDELTPLCLNKVLKTGRDLMQFLGTDVIRVIRPNWHVEQLGAKIDFNHNYIVDDMRFKNEKDFLESRGALMFFVLRPRQFVYDHHESEVSLRWHDFSDWIVNNKKTSKEIAKKFDSFIRTVKRPTVNLRSGEKFPILEFRETLKRDFLEGGSSFLATKYKWSMDSVNLWLYKLNIYRNREIYSFDHFAFSEPTAEAAYFAGLLAADGCVKDNAANNNVILSLDITDNILIEKYQTFLKTDKPAFVRNREGVKHGIDVSTTNHFILENIKLWNIKPRKSQKEEVPWIIQHDVERLKAWIVGLIDGDGSISFSKGNVGKWPNLKPSFKIQILSSKAICSFLDSMIPIHKAVRQHKDTELMELAFYNHYAVDFFNWLGRPNFGLERKWQRVAEFENLNTARRTPKNEFSN